jgi:serine/threonine-protein kinase
MPAAGGTPTPIGGVENPGGRDSQVVGRIYPKMLSSGDVLAFTLWTGSLDSARVGVRSLGTGEERVLMPGSSPQLLSTGHLLFARQNSIWASRFDAAQLQALGDPVRVIENVQVNAGGLALFAVSSTGTVAYVPGVSGSSSQRMLVWVDRQGREQPLTAPRRSYRSVRLSPDGLRVAVEVMGTDGKGDIYVWDGPRSSLVRFTSDPATDTNPLWTRDGRRLVFASARTGRMTVFSQAADGTGQPERLLAGDDDVVPYAVTPDDASVAVLRSAQQAPPSLSLLSMSRGRLESPSCRRARGDWTASLFPLTGGGLPINRTNPGSLTCTCVHSQT